MLTIDLTKNFNNIFETLQKQDMNITLIAKSMGYTSSNQLHSALKGESMLSTKAITALIMNAGVNPIYLFLGIGDMFLIDESEADRIKQETQAMAQKLKESELKIFELSERIQHLEKRNADLIDISSAAIKYHKEHKDDEIKTE